MKELEDQFAWRTLLNAEKEVKQLSCAWNHCADDVRLEMIAASKPRAFTIHSPDERSKAKTISWGARRP